MKSSGQVSRMVRKLTHEFVYSTRADINATKKQLAREGCGRNPQPDKINCLP